MRKVIEFVIKQVFRVIGLFHSEKIIYFESFHGNQYSDNPRAIFEWMKEKYPEYNFVWGVNKGEEQPFFEAGVPFVHRFSIKWFLKMPRAKVWVINTRTPLWLVKSPNTRYVQTWHGTPLKKIGRDIPNVNIPGYTKKSYDASFSEESKRWDYLVSPSTFTTKVFRSAFDYQGEILEVGYPRNDVLVKVTKEAEMKKRIKVNLGLEINQKVILYAPTWRESEEIEQGKYSFTVDFPFDAFLKKISDDTVLLVRMHYLVAQQFDFKKYNDKIRNVSSYYDMSDLLAISDLLITDYSSCFFDFAITNRPIIFYIPDQKKYENEVRGLYFSMEDNVPGHLVKTPSELLQIITDWRNKQNKFDENRYFQFKEKFINKEQGEATKKVVASIVKDRE